MSDGPSYLVHQPDGATFGPADVAMLKEWVAAGIVTRTTALSIQGDELRTPAAVVPGLFEPEQQGHATAQPAEPMYQAHLASGTTDALTLADLGRMVEAGDVVSTTPISLMGGSKSVPAAVVPGLELAFRTRDEAARVRAEPSDEPQDAIQVEFEVEESQTQTPPLSDCEVGGASGSSLTTHEPAEPMYIAHLASGTTDALTFADLSRLVEAGDVVPETPISLVGGSKKVSAVVVPRLFIKALEENPWTEAPAGQLDSDSEDYFTNAMVFGVTLVLVFIALAILTKIGWPQSANAVLKPDGWLGEAWQKATGLFRLLLLPAMMAQALGSTFRTWVLIPGVWCMLAVATVTIRSHFIDIHGSRPPVDDIKAWWKYLFGLVLGIWYASLLSLVCFGPHPISLNAFSK